MLKLKYQKKEDIPQGMESLYTEQNNELVFTGVEGIKSQADIDRIMTGLTKERDDHKATKTKLVEWDGLEVEDVRKKLDRLGELEVAATGKKEEMDKRLEELTEARVKGRLAPVERERDGLKKKLETAEKENGDLKAEKVRRTIHDKVRAAATTAKVLPEAEGDALLLADQVFEVTESGEILTKENVYGVSPGLSPDLFFQEQQEKRGHWWPKSVGGGSKGGGNNANGGPANPWAAETWNLTQQGAYVREHGLDKGQQMAKLAGTTVGGARPIQQKK